MKGLFNCLFRLGWWAIIGGRILYLISRFDFFGLQVWRWINLFQYPGFMFAGALIGIIIGAYREAKQRKWDFYSLMDVVVVGLAMAQVIVAIGSFLGGSGYGMPTEWIIGVQFPGLFDRRHPVQIYEALLMMGVFYFLWWVESEYRTFSWYKGNKSEANSGFLFSSYLILFGLSQFILNWFKPAWLQFGGIRWEFFVSVLFFTLGLVLMINRSGIKSRDLWQRKTGVTEVKQKLRLGENIFD